MKTTSIRDDTIILGYARAINGSPMFVICLVKFTWALDQVLEEECVHGGMIIWHGNNRSVDHKANQPAEWVHLFERWGVEKLRMRMLANTDHWSIICSRTQIWLEYDIHQAGYRWNKRYSSTQKKLLWVFFCFSKVAAKSSEPLHGF